MTVFDSNGLSHSGSLPDPRRSDSDDLVAPLSGVALRVGELIKDWIDEARADPASTILLSARNVSFAIQYCALHHTSEGLREAVNEFEREEDCPVLRDKSAIPALVNSVVRAEGFADVTSPESAFEVLAFIYERVAINGFWYHGFNGNTFDDISKMGMAPIGSTPYAEQFRELKSLPEMPSIYLGGYAKYDEFCTSWSANPRFSIDYASRGPEWFHFLTGWNVSRHTNHDKLRDRFLRKMECDPHLSKEKAEKMMSLFEFFWAKFTPQEQAPGLAMISRRVDANDSVANFIETFKPHWLSSAAKWHSDRVSANGTDKEMLHARLTGLLETGLSETEAVITPAKLQLIRLPTFSEMGLWREDIGS